LPGENADPVSEPQQIPPGAPRKRHHQMWRMSDAEAVIFIALVAAMVAVSLMLLA
jgi:hypothetical protein